MTDRLQCLLESCELFCVRECCGLAAFDFRPVNIAAHLIANAGNDEAEQKAESLVELVRSEFGAIRRSGDVGSDSYEIEAISDALTLEELNNLERELIHNLEAAVKIVRLDAASAYQPETFQLYDKRLQSPPKGSGREEGVADQSSDRCEEK